MALGSKLGMQTAWARSMIGFYAPGLPDYWLASTGSGTTSTRSLCVQYTQHYPAWTDANSSATLPETAISSPALAYNGDGTTGEVLIAWTGTDYYHHLNVATQNTAAACPSTAQIGTDLTLEISRSVGGAGYQRARRLAGGNEGSENMHLRR